MSSWDRFNPQLHLKNTLVEINAASQRTACVVLFRAASASLQSQPASQPISNTSHQGKKSDYFTLNAVQFPQATGEISAAVGL